MVENSNEESADPGTSRRQALKAGIGVGVGLVAWSGPTITSMGGTPAYAATCTNFTVNQSVIDRNTTQAAPCLAAGGSLTYQPISLALGAGYSLILFTSARCNDTRYNTQLIFPAGQTCQVEIRVNANGNFATGPYNANLTFGPSAVSPIPVYVPSAADYLGPVIPNARWSVRVQCVPSEASSCFFS